MGPKTKVKITYHSSSEDESENEAILGGGEADDELEADMESMDEMEDDDASSEPSGLANVMQSILRKKFPGKETAILAKARTDKQIAKKKKHKEELTVVEDEPKLKKIKSEDGTTLKLTNAKKMALLREKRKMWEEMGRRIPDILNKDRERNLQKIATRGVVQLFNAVRQQQKKVEEKLTEAGPSVCRQDKALQSLTKGQFIDVLKGLAPSDVKQEKEGGEEEGEQISIPCEVKIKEEPISSDEEEGSQKAAEKTQPAWSILRDDFMMGAKMKDWNKESDSEESDPDT